MGNEPSTPRPTRYPTPPPTPPPSNSPTYPAPASVYVGVGQLLDSDGDPYNESNMFTGGQLSTDDADGCNAKCSNMFTLFTSLVGYSYYNSDSGNLCRCYVMDAGNTETVGKIQTPIDSSYGQTWCYSCRSEDPSSMPSSQPSKDPSSHPSGRPSMDPSSIPSKSPSSAPSDAPSKLPSSLPSEAPSSAPSDAPSKSPSSFPSEAPSNAPSDAPSNSPSSVPSEAPSSAPSGAPSKSPSSFPSEAPSNAPSDAPSNSPSSVPSEAPSSAPSGAPSKSPSDVPSVSSWPSKHASSKPSLNLPTKAPSTAPTTERPTKSPSPDPNTQVIVKGTTTIDADLSSLDSEQVQEFAFGFCKMVEQKSCPKNKEYKSCTCYVKSLNGVALVQRLRRLARQLQSSGSVIDYELVIEAICASLDCSDAQTLANEVYAEVTTDMRGAINDGSLVSSLRAISSNLDTLLDGATVSGDFSEVVVPILALLALWYPSWGGSNKCLNDGNEPVYMKIFGTYYEKSLDACCHRFFSWDIKMCKGDYGTVPSGFYPNWGSSETKCLNSTATATTVPSYMVQNSGQWLLNDIKSCCERHYNWVYSDCISLSGGNSTKTATGKWYVNHQEEICQQDCPEEGGGACGVLAAPWDQLYATAADCCAEKLSWVTASTCEAQSLLSTVVGTSLWYVDWGLEKCVKDCNGSSDVSCGGLRKSWDQLYVSSGACCERIWYVDRDECMVG